jgi:multiple sugar transport system substrate-binding protein
MMASLSRRQLFQALAGLGAGAALPWLAACGAPASPTAAPAKADTKPDAAPAGATPAPAATTQPTPAAAKAGGAQITVRYMERAGALGDFMRHWSRQYEEKNPGVVIKNEGASWGDLSTKVQTYVAAGTMADVAFQHGQLMLPELAAKGVWMDLEAPGNTDKHDWKIYYKWALDSLRIGPDNKLVALPMGIHSGQNQLLWNKELLQKAGVKEPTADTTLDDLTQFAVALKQALPDVWPIMSGVGHWDMEAHSRSFKGYLISEDRKTSGFELPETQAAHRYIFEWINGRKVQPGRQEIQGNQAQMFWSQKLAIAVNCAPNIYVGFNDAVAGKFTLGDVMWPSKPTGVVGTVPSADANVIYGKTKAPEHAWGLVKLISSFEASKQTAVSPPHMTPGAVVAAWHDPDVWKAAPPYKTLALFLDDLDKRNVKIGSIPVPANTRRAEYDDLYNNEWAAMVYGEKPFDKDGVAALNKKLQAIMDKPLP